MGLGRFGGGVGVARFLAAQGADVLVTDLDPADKLRESLAQIEDLVGSERVALRLGEHNVSDFTSADLVVANPAVPKPWENRFLRAAAAAGVPITTEIRLLVDRLPARERTIGITGSAGKSTTTAMVAHALRAAMGEDRVHLGGNIGGSLLGSLDRIRPTDWVVLELSSAMLYWLGDKPGGPEVSPTGWSPAIGAVTNITPNHVDWHGAFEHYRDSKLAMAQRQDPARDRMVTADSLPASAQKLIDEGLRLAIPGAHNRVNARLALAISLSALRADRAGARADDEALVRTLLEALNSFPGLPHRLELVCAFGEGNRAVRAFNDSKCTTPEAAALAIGAFAEPGGSGGNGGAGGAQRVHLIAGGYDKKVDLSPMVAPAARCAAVYTIGATGPALAAAIRAKGSGCAVHECGELARAVSLAAEAMRPGDVLLLSPGCASWDQFTNYEARGDQFRGLARDHLSGRAATSALA